MKDNSNWYTKFTIIKTSQCSYSRLLMWEYEIRKGMLRTVKSKSEHYKITMTFN